MAGNRPFDPRRFRDLILLLSLRSSGDEWFGATKLNKALYYCDFIAYKRLGSSITGATYRKLREGPVPRELLREREAMVAEEEIALETRQFFSYVQQRTLPLSSVEPRGFEPPELEIIEEVLRVLGPMTAKEASDLSHDEVGWAAAEPGEEIPYETAFLLAGPLPADAELGMLGLRR